MLLTRLTPPSFLRHRSTERFGGGISTIQSYDWVTAALLFIGPSYVANAAPLIFRRGTPIDGGRNLADGRPILGSHKTLHRKSTRLNSSHRCISYAVFCLKKKKWPSGQL